THKQCRRHHQWKCNIPKHLKRFGTFQHSRFIYIRRQILQTRKVKNHIKTNIFPDNHDNQSNHDDRAASKPIRSMGTEYGHKSIGQSIFGCIDEKPYIGNRNQRDDNRIEKRDRKSTRLNSSHVSISYAVFCLKKKKKTTNSNKIVK